MTDQVSRRGLLGILAMAPVAAALPVASREIALGGWVQGEITELAYLRPSEPNPLYTQKGILIRSSRGLSHPSASVDRAPGKSECSSWPALHVAQAAASDQAFDHIVLKHARAC